MQEVNKNITYTFDELKEVLEELEMILISLHKMGSYYGEKFHTYGEEMYRGEYEKETTRFIDEWRVCEKLAKVRSILSDRFDRTLGEDYMDDLEREMDEIRYWSKPGDML
ncbi:hypothetical protein B0P06_004250 [Clostridium saccharoperbutylacetonicum]|uniref:Uncharacterized protein n=1 Tax=Clostridium saccharoperbutylacetonicum N1-4(HMT) TaxID=931276 RepID=M1MRS2_9CLOT|nr:hypothetical protein [Clostridium saccharoperbutylacetonicum]AGF57451.1 hypothetical protein Cspa_c36910 [Clostridium saccharoperbutylacetonicum N1-4(HMT)]NRT61783.1 hypothetical protein [Clostridium saccharoperbutylacetonicum]NSB25107.1 hypothetical protein [Clostridium saccharoperbutylacetonicum]NSB44479.1 hypothetical protein [Clostridium saccharoperbutylacetonicum]